MTTGSPSRRNSRALQEHQPKGAVDQLAAEVNQKAALKNGSSENNTVVPHIHSEGPSAIWTSLSVTDETPDFACHGYKCALVLSREQERRKVDEDDRKEFTSVRNGIARPEDLVVDEANGKLATEMLMLWGSDGETIRNEVHSLDFGSRRWTRRHPLVASDPNYAKFPTKSASNGRSRNHDAISKKAKAAFGCCSHGSKVYIFGGLPSNPARKSQASDEILEYDAFTDTITVLTPINPEETNKDGTRLAPRPAIGSTLTYVPPLANSDEHPCLYLYGGLVDGRDYNELHVFDLKTRRWSLPVHDSSQRAYRLESHSALYHPGNSKGAGRKIIVFGGMHETLRTSDNKLRVERSNDVFYLNIKPNGHVTWFKVEPEGEKPPGRSMHSAVLWGAPQGPHMVIFGGWVETYAPHPKLYEPEEAENVGIDHDSLLQSSRWRCTNDLWVYDIARGFWKRCLYEAGARSPSPRSGHSAVMYLNQMYIFGGRSGYNNSGLHVMGVEGSKLNFANDAWVCDLGTPPPPGELKTDSVGSDRISLSWVDPFRFHSDRKIRISIRELKAAGKNDAHKTVEGDWHHICEDFAMKGRLEVRSSDAFKLEPGRWYTLALVAVNAFGETPSLALQSLMQTQNPSPEMMMHRQSLTKMGKPLTEVKMLNEVGRAKKPVLASVVPQHEGSAIKSFKLVWKFGKDVALSGGVFRDYCIECCAMLDLHPSDLDRIVAVNGVAAKDSFKVYSKLGSERDSSGNGVSQLGAPWVEIWRGQESFAEITATQLLQNSAVVLAYERLMENRRKALDTLSRRERDGGRGATIALSGNQVVVNLSFRVFAITDNGNGYPSDPFKFALYALRREDTTGTLKIVSFTHQPDPAVAAPRSDVPRIFTSAAPASTSLMPSPIMTTRTEDLDELFAMPDMTLNRATVDTSRALSPAIEASTRDEMSGVEYAVVKELPVVAVAVTGQAQLDPMAQDAEDREMDDDFASEQLELAELEPERPHPLQKKRAEAEEPEQQEPEPQRPEPGDREPKQLVPKQSATRQPGRQQPEPAQRGPQLAEPKQAEQKDAEPKQIEPKHAKPKQANPELAKSKQAEPKAAAPQEAAPKEAGLQQTEILPPEREPMEVEKEVSEPEEPQSDSASEKKRKRRSSHSVDPDAEIDSPDEDEAEFDEEDEPAARKNASKRQKSITKSSRVTIHDPLDNSEDDDMDLAQRQKKLRSAGLSKSQTLVALKASPKRRRTRNQHDELPLAEESAPEEPPVAPEKPGTKGDMTVEKVTDEFIRTGSWEVGDPHAPWHARLKYGDTIDVFYNEEPKTWYHSRVLYYIRYTDSDKTFLKVHYSGYQKKFDRIFDIRDPVTAQHLRPPDKDTEIEAEVAVAAARETYVAEDKEAYGLSHPDINKGHREAVINGKVVVSNKQMPKQKRKSIAG